MTRPIGRRAFACGLAALVVSIGAFWLSAASEAQQPGPPRHIGVVLVGFSPESKEAQAFREALQDAGYAEGRDVVIEWRSANGDYDQVPRLVADLIQRKVNVIVVDSTRTAQAAKRATSTIPIVMAIVADPVGSGLVTSLAGPEGNITGLSMMMTDIVAKRLQLVKEFLPGLKRIGLLQDPSVPWHSKAVQDLLASAKSMSIKVTVVSAGKPVEFDGAFSALRRARVQALYVLDNAFFSAQRETILRLAAQSRLPVACGARMWVENGALLSYSADFSEMFRRAASYVDKLLRGAKPGDLPIEQPTKFELVINLKTAKTHGLKIPDSMLVQASEVIR